MATIASDTGKKAQSQIEKPSALLFRFTAKGKQDHDIKIGLNKDQVAVVVSQLVEWLLPTLEILGSNSVI